MTPVKYSLSAVFNTKTDFILSVQKIILISKISFSFVFLFFFLLLIRKTDFLPRHLLSRLCSCFSHELWKHNFM